jgi:small subunit ribosomal protein S2
VETKTETAQIPELRELLDAGVHFGHQTKRWNPKMQRFIFDKRNGIHIIDLNKSLVMLERACEFIGQTVLAGQDILFVGTKKQAQSVIKELALSCGQHYVTNRWMGGMLTNASTIRSRVQRLIELEAMDKDGEIEALPKKEGSRARHELEKLRRDLGGVSEMNRQPGALVIVDVSREINAVREANRLNIPVIAIVDTNADPTQIDYPIPGNDDAIRSIKLIVGALAKSTNTAKEEYSRIAAEEERKRQEAEAAAAKARAEAEAAAAKARKEAEKKAAKVEAAAAKARKEAKAETEEKKTKKAEKEAAAVAEAAKAEAEKKASAEAEIKAEEKPVPEDAPAKDATETEEKAKA